MHSYICFKTTSCRLLGLLVTAYGLNPTSLFPFITFAARCIKKSMDAVYPWLSPINNVSGLVSHLSSRYLLASSH